MTEETDDEKKHPIRDWMVRVALFGGAMYIGFIATKKPSLRDLIPPEQLQQIEQRMQQDQQYQQYQQSELPEAPPEAPPVNEGWNGGWNEDGGEVEEVMLDADKIAKTFNLLVKRDDHLLQRLEALERRMLQMKPAYQNGMPR